MFKSYQIIYKLFRNSFVFTAILYLIALLLFISIVALKDAYKMSLQNEFATKQPHIKIEYIDNNILLSQSQIKTTMRQIKDISNSIDTISPYTDGNRFFVSVGYKGSSGNAQYSGSIKVIGLGVDISYMISLIVVL